MYAKYRSMPRRSIYSEIDEKAFLSDNLIFVLYRLKSIAIMDGFPLSIIVSSIASQWLIPQRSQCSTVAKLVERPIAHNRLAILKWRASRWLIYWAPRLSCRWWYRKNSHHANCEEHWPAHYRLAFPSSLPESIGAMRNKCWDVEKMTAHENASYRRYRPSLSPHFASCFRFYHASIADNRHDIYWHVNKAPLFAISAFCSCS